MRLYLLVLALFASSLITAQELTVTDVTLFRGAVQESSYALRADADDNVYLSVSHYLDFLYDPEEDPLPGDIGRSGAVIKRDAQGNTVWAYGARYAGEADCESIGCFGYARQLALRPGGAGIYAGFEFGSPIDVDNGPGTELVNDGVAVVQIDASGDYQTVYRFNSESFENDVSLRGMATDEMGNLYVAGTYRTSMTISTGTDLVSLPQAGEPISLFNGFIGRISPEGTFDWIHSIPTGSVGGVLDALTYRDGELHWVGTARNGVDFDPTPVILRTDLRSSLGTFVVRYTSEGRVLSLFTFADREDSGFVQNIKLGADGKYYAIGVNRDNINLTADDATSPTINSEAWIASWRQDGTLRWFQEYADTRVPSIDVDAAGIVYISASADVDIEIPGPDGSIMLTPGSTEISFLQSVSQEGFLSDPVQLVSSSQTRGTAVAVSPTGRLYWTGTYRGELTAPAGVITASEDIDVFLLTLDGAISVNTQSPVFEVAPTLFPNPADDYISVRMDRAYSGGQVTIFGADGRQWLARGFDGTERVDIPIAALPTGYYLARVMAGGRIETVPFVVQ